MADVLGKLVVERIEEIYAFDPATDDLLWILDEPTEGSLSQEQETVWAEGKGGRRLYGLDRNKTVSMTATNGYLVVSALQSQVGGDLIQMTDDNKVVVPVIEYVPAAAGTLTLEYTPVDGSVKKINVANSDLTQGKKYDSTAFTVDGKTITLGNSVDEGDKTATYIVAYERECSNGFVITNDSDTYAGNAKVIYVILCHDACDLNKKYYTELEFPNAKVDGNFTLDISGDAVVQELNIEAMADVCSKDKRYFNWYIIED